MESAFREEFARALELLGRAFDAVVARGYEMPILVGGGAVEYYTGSAVVSGDFDVVTPAQEALEAALIEQGFRKEDRQGWLQRGYYHPDLAIGVEVVGSRLLDGHADKARAVLVNVAPDSDVAVIAVEDLIADRMGQYCSKPGGVKEMLDQAAKLFLLAPNLDENYLDTRIRAETAGTHGLQFLKATVARQ